MDIYTINKTNYRRETIIEEYESFIWTDRYSSYGDVELVAQPTPTMLSRFRPGTLLGFDQSKHVMEIESVAREEDEQGKRTLKIKGKSFEKQLEGRVAKKTWANTPWAITGTPGDIAIQMVNDICILGTGISPLDVIPYLTFNDRSGPSPSYTAAVKPGTIYERVKEVCDSFDLGFQIIQPEPSQPTLVFEVYKGIDRTGLGGVAFSAATETLSQTSYLMSKANYKNVAYVYTNTANVIVSATGATTISGLDRNVLLVDATDITLTGLALTEAMKQRGRDALASRGEVQLFDGTVNPVSDIRYGRDYSMGDMVVLVGDELERREVRVTEHIWAFDSTGFSSYPTFSALGGV